MYVLFSFLCFFLHRQLKEENNDGKEKLRIDPLASSQPLLSRALVAETFLWTLQGPGSASLVPGGSLSFRVGGFSHGLQGQECGPRRDLLSACATQGWKWSQGPWAPVCLWPSVSGSTSRRLRVLRKSNSSPRSWELTAAWTHLP